MHPYRSHSFREAIHEPYGRTSRETPFYGRRLPDQLDGASAMNIKLLAYIILHINVRTLHPGHPKPYSSSLSAEDPGNASLQVPVEIASLAASFWNIQLYSFSMLPAWPPESPLDIPPWRLALNGIPIFSGVYKVASQSPPGSRGAGHEPWI